MYRNDEERDAHEALMKAHEALSRFQPEPNLTDYENMLAERRLREVKARAQKRVDAFLS